MQSKSPFAEFIEQAYVEWQAKQKRRVSMDDFATLIGYSQATISLWMSGKRKPGQDAIYKLSQLFGPEVYDSLNMPRPDPLIAALLANWEWLTDEEKETFQNITERAAARHAESNATS